MIQSPSRTSSAGPQRKSTERVVAVDLEVGTVGLAQFTFAHSQCSIPREKSVRKRKRKYECKELKGDPMNAVR